MKGKQYFIKHVKHDLYSGIVSGWKKYVLFAVFILFLCIRITANHKVVLGYTDMEEYLTFGDYIVFILKGMPVFRISSGEIYIPEMIWILLYVSMLVGISYYPVKDLHGYGQIMLLQSKKREYWWLSKCVWNICSIVCFYIVLWSVVFLFSIFAGKLSFMPQQRIQLYYHQMNVAPEMKTEFISIVILLPIIVIISISLFEMLLAVLISPIIGMIIAISICILSIYFSNLWMLGNYLMPMRNCVFNISTEICFKKGFTLAVILIMLSTIAGSLGFKRKDLLEIKDE